MPNTVTLTGQVNLAVQSDINVIDGVHFTNNLSELVLENLFIKLRTRNGFFVDGRYDESAYNAGGILIPRVIPTGDGGRTMGANGTVSNNGVINSDGQSVVNTEQYMLQFLHTYDTTHVIADHSQDMLPVDMINRTIGNMGGEIAQAIDASTLAAAIKSASLALGADGTYGITIDPATQGYPIFKNQVSKGAGKLANGSLPDAIYTFGGPYSILLRSSIMHIAWPEGTNGNGSLAQDMINRGISGYDAYMLYGVGTSTLVMGHMVTDCPDTLFMLAEKWLGLTTGALNGVHGLMVCKDVLARGITSQSTRVVQSTERLATNILPKIRWGVEALYQRGCMLIQSTLAPIAAITKATVIRGPGKGAYNLPNPPARGLYIPTPGIVDPDAIPETEPETNKK